MSQANRLGAAVPLLAGALAGALGVLATGDVHLSGWFVPAYAAAAGALISTVGNAVWRLARRRPVNRAAMVASFAIAVPAALHFFLAPSAPAVIVVVIDCMRADRLDPDVVPNLSRLASTSYRFANARSQAPWTRSSVPSLLSGRMPVEHGLYRIRPAPDVLNDDVRLISQEFQDAGWTTAAFVQQAQLDPAFGMARGFDHYRFRAGWMPALSARLLRWHALWRHVPRFVFVHILDLHGPYTPTGRFKPDVPAKMSFGVSWARHWRKTIEDVRAGRVAPTTDDWKHLAASYDAELGQLDARLGAAWDRFSRDGTLDHSWIVVTSDHGEMLGEHGDLEHMRTPWEVLLRVPLVVRPPGGAAAARSIPDVVQHVDVVPTLLSAVGLPLGDGLAGRDLSPLFRGETLPPVPAFAEEWSRPDRRAAVQWGGWKLIHEDTRIRLFDLAADPGEETDRAADQPETARALEGMIAAYFEAAAEGRPVAGVDWEAAAAAGRTWMPEKGPARDAKPEAVDGLSEETLEELRSLGYFE